MAKKITFMFFLIILLFLAVGVASASEGNSTDMIENAPDDNPIAAADLDGGNSKQINDNTDEIRSDSSDNTKTASSNNNAVKSTAKTKLKIKTYANFVKKGKKYKMYLVDENGKAVAKKKVKVTLNGKTYKKTTAKNGKIKIKITSKKSYVKLKVKCAEDKKHYAFSKKVKVFVQKSVDINIGNTRLLTNGYLRIYLQGAKKAISKKTITVTVSNKTFTQKTSSEGFVVIKPEVGTKKYEVTVRLGKYWRSKNVQGVEGDVKDPLKSSIPTKGGVPDVDMMPANYVMGDGDAKYTLLKAHYQETIKRDSYCLFTYSKLSKYTLFKTKASPGTYHILKREKWNVIERALNKKLVKAYKYSYWPASITVSLKGKSYTYPVVRDVQNTGYNCGPTSASVCSQVLKNYYSERYFMIEGHCTNGMNIPDIKNLLEKHNFKTYYYYGGTSFNNAMKELKKGAALICYLPNHYVTIVDISSNGKKVLVSNSYGSYNVGSKNVPTNWVTIKYLKSKFAGIGLVVKLNYKLDDAQKQEVANYYNSMGTKWTAHNVHERIPNT